MFVKYFYIQVRENSFTIKNLSKPDSMPVRASAPFSSERMLLADFTAAVGCLRKLLREANSTWLPLIARVIIHPLEKTSGGVSPVEIRAFQELAEQAGAFEVVVWTGVPLSDAEALIKLKK